ncbi:prophage cp4-57 regulatory [Lampropedia cohaerens]|uniref:Prophage cp4-57 regulatory n=1 Tax=Lampropedia cohaerens TaxID=1610491 RepID=A0A0U1PWL4_9BURK|nr:AlpA family phage regulatory protein [Lampropedia cohaerens]KKW66933.1 prophage cp4-57 regulatory [Lampropedia cohaerens]
MTQQVSLSKYKQRSQPQSIYAAQIQEALLKIETVRQMTGFSEATIRRRVAAGDFPAPRKFGIRCTRWVAGEVREWLRKQAQ